MGFDYYIIKVLQVYYSETEYFDFELERQRANFYNDLYDEDEDNYDEKLEAYKKSMLTPQMEPIIIYSNGVFNKPSCERKYKSHIEYEIKYIGKNWSDIIKILKVEKRFER
jgi:hypothetical protein